MPRDGEETKGAEIPWIEETTDFRAKDFRIPPAIAADALRDAVRITGIDQPIFIGMDPARNGSDRSDMWLISWGSDQIFHWAYPASVPPAPFVSQARGRKLLADALIRALRDRPDDFTSRAGHRGYLDDGEVGHTWDLEYPFHIQMSESTSCTCQELDLGPWHSLRVWFAVARWRKRHGDYSAHAEEAARLDAARVDPPC